MKNNLRRLECSSIRHLIPLLVVLALGACGPPLAMVGFGAAAVENRTPGITSHNIFFATTRARSADDIEFYGGHRSFRLASGRLTVGIPPVHKAGQIEVPKSAADHDPQKHFSMTQPLVFDGTKSFRNGLRRELASRPPENRDVLVFVHGYNTSFSGAVTRVAQFVHDTGFEGVPVLFTWASRAKTSEYVYDINSALQARFHMAELALAMQDIKSNEYSIVAHSMGNLVTLETLVVLNSMPEFNPRGDLRAIILAAPDVDIDLFSEHMVNLGPMREKVYVLTSADDKALGVSRIIAGGISRAGAANPDQLAKLGITVVDLSKISDKSNADHNKFSASPEIVQLIGRSINEGNTLSTAPEASAVQSTVGGLFQQFSLIRGGGRILSLGN